MRYLGGKSRLMRHIGPILQSEIDKNGICEYIEPFVGGCGSMDRIRCGRRVGLDGNPYLITFWEELLSGYVPPDCISEDEYNNYKRKIKRGDFSTDRLEAAAIGFAGIACAFSGSWYAGYSKADGRNRCAEAKRAVLKQLDKLSEVEFIYADYKKSHEYLTRRAVIYLDPPYATVPNLYQGSNIKYDPKEFWEYALFLSTLGHIVYVSEYTSPDDPRIACVWSKDVKVCAHQISTKKRVERLYKVNGVAYN